MEERGGFLETLGCLPKRLCGLGKRLVCCSVAVVWSGEALVFFSKALLWPSKALVWSSEALVSTYNPVVGSSTRKMKATLWEGNESYDPKRNNVNERDLSDRRMLLGSNVKE